LSEGFSAKVAEVSPLIMLMCITKNQNMRSKASVLSYTCVTFSSALFRANEGRRGMETMHVAPVLVLLQF